MTKSGVLVCAALILVSSCREDPPAPAPTSTGPVAPTTAASQKPPAEKPLSCRERVDCIEEGRCTDEAGRCVAKTDEDCEKSLQCRAFNRCTAGKGRCRFDLTQAPVSMQTCKKYSVRKYAGYGVTPCRLSGECQEDGTTCVAASEADCKASEACEFSGRCTMKAGECIAADARACAESGRCCWDGACSLVDGRCVAKSDEDCERSAACLAEGRCKAHGGRCVVGETRHCKQSRSCQDYGLCVAKEGRCVGTDDAGCKASRICALDGLCSAGQDHCIAKGADCEGAVVCKRYGRCKAAHRSCFFAADDKGCRGFHGAEGKTPCFDFGECKEQAGVCIAESETRCAVSTFCKWKTCKIESHRCREPEGDGAIQIGNQRYVTDPASCWFACVNDRSDALDKAFHCGTRLTWHGGCYGPHKKFCELFKSKPPPLLEDRFVFHPDGH